MNNETSIVEVLDEVGSIERYIEILLNEYPNPITQTELAQESAVTKSAISKVRDRLVSLCDLEILGYYKKLVLRSDPETFAKCLFYFFSRMKPQVFLRSKYLKGIIKNFNVHEKISQAAEDIQYSDFFDEKDTNLLVKIFLYNLSNISYPQGFPRLKVGRTVTEEEIVVAYFIPYLPIVNDLSNNFDLAVFENKEELIDLLTVRDKVFFFIMHAGEKFLHEWEVVKKIENDEKKTAYLEAYLKVIEYYVYKNTLLFNINIETRAIEKGIEFEDRYNKVGEFFKMNCLHHGDICHNGEEEEAYLSNPGSGGPPLPDKE